MSDNALLKLLATLSPEKRAMLAELLRPAPEPIAIIGMGCRFPGGADSPETFWNLLNTGGSGIREVPSDRWDIDRFYDPDPTTPGKMNTRQGGFLAQVDRFDAHFFGISPREAVSLDPQQRLLTEVTWEALENAGQPLDALAESQTGVFIGIYNSDYSWFQLQDPTRLDAYAGSGVSHSIAANRLSYLFNFHGPSLVVDTACSSSLVAVHLAVQSLRNKECHRAIAGGVNLILSPLSTIAMSKWGMLAPDGYCKTFDARANGFVRGEGCGVVVLKRLSDALANGDEILALIRGTAVNQDGRSTGMTAPNGQAQQAVIRQALDNSGVDPAQVSYIEAHGTGTALGDPIEVEALTAVYGKPHPNGQPCVIGSVKTNIGHLEASAGIAGLIKVVLAMRNSLIPPHLHLERLNPHISLEDTPFVIATEPCPWPVGERRRFAGLSSFGFGGTNAHIVLEEAPQPQPVQAAPATLIEPPRYLLCLSARSEPALKDVAQRMHDYLVEHPDESPGDICYTANARRSHFSYRLAVVAETSQQMRERLAAFTVGQPGPMVISGQVAGSHHPPVAFLFTGQGAQYAGMGQQLYESLPIFRQTLDECDALLRPHLEHSLLSVIYPQPGQPTPLDETAYTQPALFALEYALAQVWLSWGIRPAAVIGHSIGEYVAACLAGVFSLEDGLKLTAARGQLMQSLPRDGEMIAVQASEELVTELSAPYTDVSLAAINGPEDTVISGASASIHAIVAQLQERGIKTRQLSVSHAFHSPLMEPILGDFEQRVAAVQRANPHMDLVSNITGELINEAVCDPVYWRRHVREPVRFAAGMQTLQQQGYTLFLEVGPKPTLLGMAAKCLPQEENIWLPSLRKDHADWEQMLKSLGVLYSQGVDADWHAFEGPYPRRLVRLPNYPFQRRRYWVEVADHQIFAVNGSKPITQEDDNWLYELDWRAVARGAAQRPNTQPGTWIVFADQQGIGDALATLVTQQGGTVISVSSGTAYEQVAAGRIQLDPTEPAHFRQLFADVAEADGPPVQCIVHLWSLDTMTMPATAITGVALHASHRFGCESVLHLVQALAESEERSVPSLWVVTSGAQSLQAKSDPALLIATPLWGMGRVIATEHPEMWGGLIDLDPQGNISPEVAADIYTEIDASDGEQQVAFRQGQRYVARLIPVRPQPHPQQPWQFANNGTYLITGGMGGLGLTVARWMVEQGARNLVLVGRRAPSDGTLGHIRQIEELGAKIVLVQADIAQEDQVRAVLDQISQTLPPLRGIIHAAGVLDDGVLLRQFWERFVKVMDAKVQGTWNLHNLTRDLSLDCFVLFSSLSALIGTPGQANYAAANAFLDGFAYYRRTQGLPALSINWGPWAEVGMAAASGSRSEERRASQGIAAFSPPEGTRALGQTLAQHLTQVAVVQVDWAQFLDMLSSEKRTLFAELVDTAAGQHEHPGVAQAVLPERLERALPGARQDIVFDYIHHEVANVLGLESPTLLQPYQKFFEAGMDSLMAVELKRRLESASGCSLPTTVIFNYPTVESLAVYLSQVIQVQPTDVSTPTAPSGDPRQPDSALIEAEIELLSEEEAAALLAEELAKVSRGL